MCNFFFRLSSRNWNFWFKGYEYFWEHWYIFSFLSTWVVWIYAPFGKYTIIAPTSPSPSQQWGFGCVCFLNPKVKGKGVVLGFEVTLTTEIALFLPMLIYQFRFITSFIDHHVYLIIYMSSLKITLLVTVLFMYYFLSLSEF